MVTETYIWNDKEAQALAALVLQQHPSRRHLPPPAAAAAAAGAGAAAAAAAAGLRLQRFKGLGEMEAHQLWQTAMNPKTRILKKITLQDALKVES